MAVRGKTKQILESSIDAALLGVEIYNKPRTSFRSQNFIVLMTIAWTRLFHAHFRRTIGDRYYYKRKGKYEIVDGERKAWELSTCIDKFGKLSVPAEANLRFFIGLRNKIEHRTTLASETDTLIFGECQSLLYNYESTLQDLFGPEYALHDSLVFSLQFSRLRRAEQKQANKRALQPEAQEILEFVAKYRSTLPDEIYDSQEYSVKLICVPRISNTNRCDLAVEFVRWSELDEKDRQNYSRLTTIIKERVVEKEAPKTIRVVDRGSGGAPPDAVVVSTANREHATATLVYETLADGIFDDVNKIVEANQMLSANDKSFKFDQTIYYRVYAGRENVKTSEETYRLLTVTGLRFYAPCFFWLTQLPDKIVAEVMKEFVAVPKFPRINTASMLCALLGNSACDWIEEHLESSSYRDPQDDQALQAIRKMKTLLDTDDARLAAIRQRRSAEILLPDRMTRIKLSEVLTDNVKARDSLSKYCAKAAGGDGRYRTICRLLDVLAFGTDMEKRGYGITKYLCT